MTLTLADLGNISLVLGALVGLLSVVMLFRELRENNKLTRAANTQALVELSAPFFMGLIQDRKMAELYVMGGKDGAQLDERRPDQNLCQPVRNLLQVCIC